MSKREYEDTVRAVVGRYGRCMDCANWRPQGDRAWASRGACDQHERATTSYDAGCNGKFREANAMVLCPLAGRHKACRDCSHSQTHGWKGEDQCRGRCEAARRTLQCVAHNASVEARKPAQERSA